MRERGEGDDHHGDIELDHVAHDAAGDHGLRPTVDQGTSDDELRADNLSAHERDRTPDG
ncbi:MAG: hypothetical protein AB7Q42_00875 [Acidimicrobiia bacterium]